MISFARGRAGQATEGVVRFTGSALGARQYRDHASDLSRLSRLLRVIGCECPRPQLPYRNSIEQARVVVVGGAG